MSPFDWKQRFRAIISFTVLLICWEKIQIWYSFLLTGFTLHVNIFSAKMCPLTSTHYFSKVECCFSFLAEKKVRAYEPYPSFSTFKDFNFSNWHSFIRGRLYNKCAPLVKFSQSIYNFNIKFLVTVIYMWRSTAINIIIILDYIVVFVT